MRKARIWRAFLIKRKFSENRNAWLGREGSNLRMAESKSGEFKSKFNEPSEFSPYVHPSTALMNFPRSEWPRPATAFATARAPREAALLDRNLCSSLSSALTF
jgi:hypothetical protein